MKKLGILLVTLITATLVLSTIGCSGGGGGGVGATASPTHTVQATATGASTPTPGQNSATGGLVSPDELAKFLPATPPSGWTAAGNASTDINTDLYTYHNYALALMIYQADNHMNSITLSIADYGAYLAGSERGPESLSNSQGSAAYQKITVDGYPAWQREPSSTTTNTAFVELVVLINNRFAVDIQSSTFGDQVPFDQWTSLIDFAGIAALN